MIILPSTKNHYNAHPLVPEMVIKPGHTENNLFHRVVHGSENPNCKLHHVITSAKALNYYWLSIAEYVESNDTYIIRMVNPKGWGAYRHQTEGNGIEGLSQHGRLMSWLGEYLYDCLIKNVDIIGGQIFYRGTSTNCLASIDPFLPTISEYCAEREINVPVLDNGKRFKNSESLKPKKTDMYYALFDGIRAHVQFKSEIEYHPDLNGEERPFMTQLDRSGFKPTRNFVISPALDVPKYDQGYQMTIVEEDFSSANLSLRNQKIVASWLQSVAAGM